MGWLTLGASGSSSDATSNKSTYGTNTPNVSQQATDAFGNIIKNTNASGANPTQQSAIDWQKGNLLNNPVNAQTGATNTTLGQDAANYGWINQNLLGPIATQGAPQAGIFTAGGTQSAAQAPTNAAQVGLVQAGGAPLVGAGTGAEAALGYAPLFSQSLVDPSLRAFDYGTDRAYSALDARTAGAGAFANSRSGLGYSDLGAQSALQRGQLEAGLLTSGLNTAVGAGTADANRSLLAGTTNAGNLLQNNQFNAGLLQSANSTNAGLLQNSNQFNSTQGQQNNQFNAGLGQANNQFNAGAQNQGSQFNVGATQQNTAQKLAAAQGMAANLAAKSGIDQGILANIVTQNGVNTQAAQALFAQGAITQSQLNDILGAAQQWNGSTYSQDTTGTSHASGTNWNAGLDLPNPMAPAGG